MKNSGEIKMFCKNIKILRESNDLNKKEVADILEIGIRILAKIEQGVMPPGAGINIIFNLSQNFNIKPHKLFVPL